MYKLWLSELIMETTGIGVSEYTIEHYRSARGMTMVKLLRWIGVWV